jgi:hypothetical protein
MNIESGSAMEVWYSPEEFGNLLQIAGRSVVEIAALERLIRI